jgi:hypothetical protein
MIRKVRKINEKEAIEKKSGLVSKKEVKHKIENKKNQYYDTLWTGITFDYKEQNEGGKKLIAKLPSGKYVFLDKGENTELIKPGIPYICLIYEPVNDKTGKEMSASFAKIVCPESVPKIIVNPDGMIYMIYRDDKGNFKKEMIVNKSYSFRIVEAFRKFENQGIEEARIIFAKNKMKERKKQKDS